MRGSVKGLAEGLLVNLVQLSGPRIRLRGQALVLAYHNVVERPGDAGLDHSLHLPFDTFRSQVEALERSHPVVPLDQLLQASSDFAPVAAITFDDAYRGALRLAATWLAARGTPFTVFAVPGRFGRPGLWWDRFGSGTGVSLRDDQRERALQEGRGADEEVARMAGREGWIEQAVPLDAGLGTAEEVQRTAALAGATIGSHTWSHPNLTRLDDTELARELADPGPTLRALAGSAYRPWLAFPYGLADDRVCAAAGAAGYAAAFRVTGGWTRRPPQHPLAVPRVNVPTGLSPAGLRLRAAGLFC